MMRVSLLLPPTVRHVLVDSCVGRVPSSVLAAVEAALYFDHGPGGIFSRILNSFFKAQGQKFLASSFSYPNSFRCHLFGLFRVLLEVAHFAPHLFMT